MINMKKHDTNCSCVICRQGMDAYKKWEQEMMQKSGWYIHYLPGDDTCPNSINIHTHGLQESFGHPDLQICISLPQNTAGGILHDLVARIKKGERLTVDKIYKDIRQQYDFKFIDAHEDGRPVLRLLIPNPRNAYDGKVYQAQFTMLNNQD